jgi:hypothetical protein
VAGGRTDLEGAFSELDPISVFEEPVGVAPEALAIARGTPKRRWSAPAPVM